MDDLLELARGLPGVQSAAVGFRVPMDFGGFWSSEVQPDGHSFEQGETPKADWNVVSPGYFRTLGISLLQGREFDERDVKGADPVTIVDERFVRRFWPDGNALGRRVHLSDDSVATVVGVVRRITYEPVGADRGVTVYQPFAQCPMSSAALHVRGEKTPLPLIQPLRSALSQLAPTLPLAWVRDLTSFHQGGQFPLLLLAQALGFLGLVTLLLAAVGTYGLVAHATARRSREFAIRLASGASPRNLYRLVLGQGARLALLALVLGLAGAMALGQVLKSVVTELGDVDTLVLGGVSLLVAAITFLALVVPARRATLTEPSVVLKEKSTPKRERRGPRRAAPARAFSTSAMSGSRPTRRAIPGVSSSVSPSGVSEHSVPGRDLGIDDAFHEPVLLQVQEGLGEHLLADAVDLPLELTVALRPVGEEVDRERGPLVGDQVEHRPGRALGAQDVRSDGAGLTNHWVPTFQKGVYFPGESNFPETRRRLRRTPLAPSRPREWRPYAAISRTPPP